MTSRGSKQGSRQVPPVATGEEPFRHQQWELNPTIFNKFPRIQNLKQQSRNTLSKDDKEALSKGKRYKSTSKGTYYMLSLIHI